MDIPEEPDLRAQSLGTHFCFDGEDFCAYLVLTCIGDVIQRNRQNQFANDSVTNQLIPSNLLRLISSGSSCSAINWSEDCELKERVLTRPPPSV